MDEILNVAILPSLVAVVYFCINIYKDAIAKDRIEYTKWIPVIAGVIGFVLGAVCYLVAPNLIPADNFIVAVLIGGASGLAATGANQIFKQQANYKIAKEEEAKQDKNQDKQ